MANLTNPLKTDLDAAGNSIAHVSALDVETMQSSTGYGVGIGGNVVFNDGAGHLLGITVHGSDPSVSGFDKPQGWVCLTFDGMYRKVGPNATDWQRIAP